MDSWIRGMRGREREILRIKDTFFIIDNSILRVESEERIETLHPFFLSLPARTFYLELCDTKKVFLWNNFITSMYMYDEKVPIYFAL